MRNSRSSGALRVADAGTGSGAAPSRRERNAAETRQRILNAAEVEFAKKGYDGARLGQIARSADVQQALIHHYFDDKRGLYREVIERALDAMSLESWDVVHRFTEPLDATRIPELVRAFVDLLMWQSVKHRMVYAIMRHASAAASDGDIPDDVPDALIRKVMHEKTKPVFDAVVGLIEALIQKGYLKSDVHPRHLCISTLALVWITVQDERLVRTLWSVDVRSPEFVHDRKEEIVKTILARVLPSP
ncbi:TetR/AcrR family transcriptional regulator [Pendulispora rubella]|uniref:TetR/AcrR family transcriptional regulator n=1 Tax=Pendulispora rubella TaxID=2741070 RepID=A0ABZ2KYQ1_9BACT